jgi:hypothetical protein
MTSLRVILDPVVVSSEKTKAEKALNEARAARDAAQAAFDSAQAKFDSLSKMNAAAEYELNVETGVLTPVKKDNRVRRDAYTFASQSGNRDRAPGDKKGHEVLTYVVDGRVDNRATCNCPAGRFGRKCWAVKKVESRVGLQSARVWYPMAGFGKLADGTYPPFVD